MKYYATKPELLQTTTCGNRIYISCHYPEENPPNAVEDITDCLAHVGVFDGIEEC